MKNSMILLVLVISLSACSSKNLQNKMKNLKSDSIVYKQGYSDGCSSGSRQAGNIEFIFMQDLTRYRSEPDYETGWNTGFSNCQ